MIHLGNIPEEGLHLEIAEKGNELQVIAGKADFFIMSPVSANLTLLKSDEEVFVRGNMASVLKFRCARCLKEFDHKISSNIDIVYRVAPEYGITPHTKDFRGTHPKDGSGVKEKELSREEVSANHLKGNEIDINAVLFEQLLLDIPMQPVCSVDCKGLCPKCGADSNHGKCGCSAAEHTDTRFAKLKELKLK